MQYLKYLYILGLLISVIGFVAGLVSQEWLPIPIVLLATGLCLIGIWLCWFSPGSKNFWQKRSTEVGTNVMLTTLAVLVILGLLNFLVVRYEVRVDLTENQLFTLSPESQAIVKDLSSPLKVWVFDTQPNPSDQELLKNYRRYNSQFSFKFIDPEVEIQRAEEFKISSLGEVYVEYKDKKEFIQKISEVERLSEAKLSTAIETIQRDRPSLTLYFLQGHGETGLTAVEGGLSEAVASLQEKGYQIKSLNLAKVSTIPKDTSLITIVSPKRKLLEGEIKTIKEYLENKGRLLLMVDPKTESGLEGLLKDWGVQLDQRIVVDVSGTGSLIGFGPATVIITNYGDHPITQAFGDGISVYPLARPISTNVLPNIEAIALLITDEQSWAETRLDGQQVKFDQKEDIKGPLDIGVALTRNIKNKGLSRLVIFGNASFATNGWFTQQLNGDVFLNTVEWLASEEDSILSIRAKEPKNRRINLNRMQAGFISWLALVFMPLLGFLTAGITWWRRR